MSPFRFIKAGYILNIALLLTLGITSIYQLQKISTDVNNIYHHPFAVSNAAQSIETLIYAMHRNMKDVALAQNKEDYDRLLNQVDLYEKQVISHYDIIFDKFLGDKLLINASFKNFIAWKKIRDEVSLLNSKGYFQEAIELTVSSGAIHVENLQIKVHDFVIFALQKADEFHQKAEDRRIESIKVVTLLTLLTLVISLFLAVSSYFYYRRRDERKQARLQKKSHSQTLELIVNDEKLSVILQAIVRDVETENPEMLCSILLLDYTGKHLLMAASQSFPDFYNEAIHGMGIGLGAGSCGTTAFTGERVIVDDIQNHPYWTTYKEVAGKAGLKACWSEPIRSSEGKVLGTFAIYHNKVQQPTKINLTLIEQSAYLASIAIEKTQTKATLLASEERYALAMQGTQDGIWDWNLLTNEILFSPRWKSMLGYTENEIKDDVSEWKRLVHPDDLDVTLSIIDDFCNHKIKKYKTEFRMQHKDGHYLNILSRAFASEGEAGNITRLVGTHTDITAQRKSEFALHQAHTKYLNLVENIGDKFVIYSHIPEGGNITYVSESCEGVFGLKKEAIIGNSWDEIINWLPEDIMSTKTIVKQQIDGVLGFYQFKMSFIHPDNTLRTLQVSNHPVRDGLGEVIAINGIVEDITERTKSEEKLKLAASVFANAREGILITDSAGLIIEVNETFSLVTG